MKALKYILILALSALACGVGQTIFGIALSLPFSFFFSGSFSLTLDDFSTVPHSTAAWLGSSLVLFVSWRPFHSLRNDLGWTALHAFLSSTLLYSFLLWNGAFSLWAPPVGVEKDSFLVTLIINLSLSVIAGCISIPAQIIPAYLHILLFRRLHARFLAPKAQTEAAS